MPFAKSGQVTNASSAQASRHGCVSESATSPMSATDADYQADETTLREWPNEAR
jgi:hypothetical protein